MLLLLALVAGFGLAACGGGGESESEKEAEAAKEAGSEITCEGTAMTGDPGLPPEFPKPSGVTYVKSTQTGPTQVVLAYYDGDLDGAYEAYKFASAGYDVPFDEKEEDDAEVSYEDADGGTTGLVALKASCDEEDRISIRITARAA